MKDFKKSIGQRVYIYKAECGLGRFKLIKRKGVIVDYWKAKNAYAIYIESGKRSNDKSLRDSDFKNVEIFKINAKNNFYNLLESDERLSGKTVKGKIYLEDIYTVSKPFFSFKNLMEKDILNRLKEEALAPSNKRQAVKDNCVYTIPLNRTSSYESPEKFKKILLKIIFGDLDLNKITLSKRFNDSIDKAYEVLRDRLPFFRNEGLMVSLRATGLKDEYGFFKTKYVNKIISENTDGNTKVDAKLYLRSGEYPYFDYELVSRLYEKEYAEKKINKEVKE